MTSTNRHASGDGLPPKIRRSAIARVRATAWRRTPCSTLALRLEEPRDIFAGGLWVHTFNSLLPASVYGAEHPEYYSFINRERRPGRASQWCLTNDELFELVAAKVDSIFRANPGMNIISISQNDSNFTYCRCEECEKVAVVSELDAFEKYVTQFRREDAQRTQQQPAGILPALPRTLSSCGDPPNLALGARIVWIDAPAEKYRASGEKTLTDGLFGGASFVESWTGWEGKDGAFVVDLGRDVAFDGRDRFPAPAGPVDSAAPFGALLRFVRQRGLDPVRAGGIS